MRHLVISDSSESWDFPEGHHLPVGVYDSEADGNIENWLNDHNCHCTNWYWNDGEIAIGVATGHGDTSDDECSGSTLFTAYRIS